MIQDSFAGASYFIKGLRLAFSPVIRRYVIIPLLVNIILFAAVIWYGSGLIGEYIESLLPEWLMWLEWLIWPLLVVTVLLVVFYTFSLVANVIAAPFNGALSEAVEHHLTGKSGEAKINYRELFRNAVPMMIDEVRKLLYFLVRAIPLLLLFVIPGIQLLAPMVWFVFSAWMLSLEYIDYPAGNSGLKFAQIRQKVKSNRMLSLGFGSITMLCTLIPFVNFLVMPVAVCGATVAWVERFRNE